MNQRPLVLLYPAAALGIAALLYMANRRIARNLDQLRSTRQGIGDQVGALRADLDIQRQLIDEIHDYLQPLRDHDSKLTSQTS